MSDTLNIDFDELAKKLSPRIASTINHAVDNAVKELGLDRVDRKKGIFPGVAGADDPRIPVQERMKNFFAAVLFGKNVEDEAVKKALSEGTDAAGGYLVPDEFRAEIVKRAPELSELYPHVRVIPVSSDTGKIPKLSTDISLSWDEAENAAFDEADPVFGQLSWSIHRMNAVTKSSRELVNDSNPNIVNVLNELFMEAVATERDKMIAIGDGSSQPKGIYSETGLDSVSVGGSITYAKLVEIKYKLKGKYQRNARWVMNSTSVQRIVSLVDNNGQPLISNALLVNGAPTILGKPFSVQDDLPDHTIFYGDLSRYYWFDREKMGIEATNVGGDAFIKHQVWIKVWERCDGKITLTEAFVKGTGITG